MEDKVLPEETPIWRYMDLERFVIMLVSGSLRYTKAAVFLDDPWDGFCKVVLSSTPIPEADAHGTIRLESAEQFSAMLAKSVNSYLCNAREHLYVSSWSLCTNSMAMWKVYGSNGRGLAIQSSIGRCKASLRFDVPADHYEFGRVVYVDNVMASPEAQEDLTASVPIPGPMLWKRITSKAFLKRSAYEHEKEWRGALYQDYRPNVTGVDIMCRFEALIDSVILGPSAPDFMLGTIEDLMGRFGITKNVVRSNLLSPPPIT